MRRNVNGKPVRGFETMRYDQPGSLTEAARNFPDAQFVFEVLGFYQTDLSFVPSASGSSPEQIDGQNLLHFHASHFCQEIGLGHYSAGRTPDLLMAERIAGICYGCYLICAPDLNDADIAFRVAMHLLYTSGYCARHSLRRVRYRVKRALNRRCCWELWNYLVRNFTSDSAGQVKVG
jgi:hypothetical protein